VLAGAQARPSRTDNSCASGSLLQPEPPRTRLDLQTGRRRPGEAMKKIASLLSTTGVLVALVAVCEAAVKWV
jgi:hypothetical protein